MNKEYGLITDDLIEKKVIKIFNDKLNKYFTEIASKEYAVYKNYNLSKMKNHHGISFNPKKIPWDYEYSYLFSHKTYGIYLEIYPNTNSNGEHKFDHPGVVWNLYVNEQNQYVKNVSNIVQKSNPDIKRFLDYLLEDLPFEIVVLYEYEKGEDRI